jgi:hypothetical protein
MDADLYLVWIYEDFFQKTWDQEEVEDRVKALVFIKDRLWKKITIRNTRN